MKVFFIGCVEFSKAMLETLLTVDEVEIVGVATKSKSQFNSDHYDLSDLAIKNSIPYKFVKNINAPVIIKWIDSLQADVIYCFGWSSLIKTDLLNLTPKGVIGYHPAYLPENRGRHPIIWALVLGLSHTASTFFKMDEGADSGDVISQVKVDIPLHFNAQNLYDELTSAAKDQLIKFSLSLAKDDYELIKQDDSKANYWRKRGRLDGEINFSSSSLTVYNLVRALSKPYVGAHLMYENKEIKIWKCEVGTEAPSNYEPGKVLEINEKGNLLIKTGDGSILITDHEFEELPLKNSYII